MSRERFGRFAIAGWGAARAGVLVGLLAAVAAPSLAQTSMQKHREMERRRNVSQFQLFADPILTLDVNQFQCGLRNQGDTCSNVFNSPTGGGGLWPVGSPNGYVFNSGLQVAGIIPADAGFAWAGDTVAAYFMDARGTQQHGQELSNIYNSLNADDIANWPREGTFSDFPFVTGFVTNPDLFNPVLLGRESASQQDSWVMYWDGDPDFLANREHPMGILVEQRTMAWNFPEGNEATIYLIYKFTNVTNNARFQRLNEAAIFGGVDALPDAGWRIDSIYAAYDTDMDVTNDATLNYSSAILPFDMGISYAGLFETPDFDYPPDIFRPPFFTESPGIVGVKYLRSPIDPATGEEVGLTMFSVHENPSSAGAIFFDPLGDKQLWRYLSGNVQAGLGDPPCTFTNPKERRLCFLAQEMKDTRFFQSSGPFSLEPGESQTIAVALIVAATVETDQIVPGDDNKPGDPSIQPGCTGGVPDPDAIRPIEIGAGWVATLSCPADPDEGVNQFDVEVVPGSLLGKALVAQSIFNAKFLLGFAPEAPDFYLVPGDNQVAIVWSESPTETAGDPFIAAAGEPLTPEGEPNPLYNPNYREFDVEGYRIYRGTDPSRLRLIAQFDYEPGEGGVAWRGVYVDNTCETDMTFVAGDECDEPPGDVDIVDPFVQYRTVVRLEDGRTLPTDADTALAAQVRGLPQTALPLSNNGVPFGFTDTDAFNGFQYFYKVTAFDINSLKSGPTSLESAGVTKSTFPQKASPNLVLASFTSFMSGDDGVPLNPGQLEPSIDPETGIFAGPQPPTNSLETTFVPVIDRLLPAFSLTARVDSIVPLSGFDNPCPTGENALGMCWKTFMTFDRDGAVTQAVADGSTPVWDAFGVFPSNLEFGLGKAVVPADAVALDQFDIPPGFVELNAQVVGSFRESIRYSSFEGQSNRRFPTSRIAGGSRWFNGAQETLADPTRLIGVGHLDEADTVWAPIHHTPVTEGGGTYPSSSAMQCFGYSIGFLGRAADVRFTWQGGTFSEVRDLTHHLNVEFKEVPQATWGFLNSDANNNGFIDWNDFNFLEAVSQNAEYLGFCGHTHDAASVVQLEDTPELQSVSTSGAAASDLQATGTGFGLYVNGERYIFEMSSLPADGTEWTLRTYIGDVRASSGNATENPSGYTFTGRNRSPMIPGLTITFESESATQLVGEPDLKEIHTVPDPYYAVSQFDLGPTTKRLRFVNLPPQATIRIYTVSGVLVDVINHNDPAAGGQATWDLRNRSNQFIASGVYFFHVVTPNGDEHIGKFTVVNFAN